MFWNKDDKKYKEMLHKENTRLEIEVRKLCEELKRYEDRQEEVEKLKKDYTSLMFDVEKIKKEYQEKLEGIKKLEEEYRIALDKIINAVR